MRATLALSSAEIREIAAIKGVRKLWRAQNATEMARILKTNDIDAWKFADFVTDESGRPNDIVVIMGHDWTPPLWLVRKGGRLVVGGWVTGNPSVVGIGRNTRSRKLSKKRRTANAKLGGNAKPARNSEAGQGSS